MPCYVIDLTATGKSSGCCRQTFELDIWNTRSSADEWILLEQHSLLCLLCLLCHAFLVVANNSLK